MRERSKNIYTYTVIPQLPVSIFSKWFQFTIVLMDNHSFLKLCITTYFQNRATRTLASVYVFGTCVALRNGIRREYFYIVFMHRIKSFLLILNARRLLFVVLHIPSTSMYHTVPKSFMIDLGGVSLLGRSNHVHRSGFRGPRHCACIKM